MSRSEEIRPAQVVVHYYDHDLATSEGTDEADLFESMKEPSDHKDIEHTEYSPVKEGHRLAAGLQRWRVRYEVRRWWCGATMPALWRTRT